MYREPLDGYGWSNHHGHKENLLLDNVDGIGVFMCDGYWSMNLEGRYNIKNKTYKTSSSISNVSSNEIQARFKINIIIFFCVVMLCF